MNRLYSLFLPQKYEQVDDEEEWDSTYCTEELTSNASHTDDETILVDDDDERSECEEAKSDHEEDDANFNVVEFLGIYFDIRP